MNRRKEPVGAVLFNFGDTLINLSPSRYEIFINPDFSLDLYSLFKTAIKKLSLSESHGDILYVGNDYTLDVPGAFPY